MLRGQNTLLRLAGSIMLSSSERLVDEDKREM